MSEPKTAEVKVVPVPVELMVRARHIIGDRAAGGRMLTPRAEASAVWNELLSIMNAEPAAPASPPAEKGEGEPHPDDLAVDRFAAAMKVKLAKKRADGRGGWEDRSECSGEFLSGLLRRHVEKGDPLDVGNLAMMLHQRGEGITAQPVSPSEGEATYTDDDEARAEAWSDRIEIQNMVEATSAVFAKSTSPELLSRFRQQIMAVIQQAYIEGSVEARTRPASDQSDTERMRAALEKLERSIRDDVKRSPDALITLGTLAAADEAAAALAEKAADQSAANGEA